MGNCFCLPRRTRRYDFDDLLIDNIVGYLPYAKQLGISHRHRINVLSMLDQRKMLSSDYIRDMNVTVPMPSNISYVNWIKYYNVNIDHVEFDDVSHISRQLYTTVNMEPSTRRKLLKSILQHKEIPIANTLLHSLDNVDPYVDILVDYPVDIQIYINKTTSRSAHHLNGAAYLHIAFSNNDYFYDVIEYNKPEYITDYTTSLRNATLRDVKKMLKKELDNTNYAIHLTGTNDTIRGVVSTIRHIRKIKRR